MTQTPLELEKSLGRDQALVVNSGLELLNVVGWERASTIVARGMGYVLLPRSTGEVIRSQKLTFAKPLVVALNRYPQKYTQVVDPEKDTARDIILRRDNWTCQYCGEYGNTMDHIFPKSRGGRNTWANLCVACKSCNGKKADRTPEEAGLARPVIPSGGGPTAHQRSLQESIYRELAVSAA